MENWKLHTYTDYIFSYDTYKMIQFEPFYKLIQYLKFLPEYSLLLSFIFERRIECFVFLN